MTAAEALELYLPAREGRSSAERVQAITGRAWANGLPRIETHLGRPLYADERDDSKSACMLAAVRAAVTYDETRDVGTAKGIPIDIRFGRFAYLKASLALIDWDRKTFGDRRPGRTRKLGRLVPLDDLAEQPSIEHGYDLVDALLSVG